MEPNKSLWKLELCIRSTCSPLEYKYIMKSGLEDSIECWEAIPGNRTINLSLGTNVALYVCYVRSLVLHSYRNCIGRNSRHKALSIDRVKYLFQDLVEHTLVMMGREMDIMSGTVVKHYKSRIHGGKSI